MKCRLLLNRIPGEVKLRKFAGEGSWLLFDLLDVDVQWMQNIPTQWPQSSAFQRFKDMIKSLNDVNDCAEHAVKDMTEYLNYSRDAERREHVQMVVSYHWQLTDFKKLTKVQVDNMDNLI